MAGKYKRPTANMPESDILHEQFSFMNMTSIQYDSPWLYATVAKIHKEGSEVLLKMKAAIETVQRGSWDDFKPEIATAKKKEIIQKARREVLSFAKKHVEEADLAYQRCVNEILRETAVPEAKGGGEAAQQMRLNEIRGIVRTTDPKNRFALIEGKLSEGKVEFLHAILDSPDDILDPENVRELRMRYAFEKIDPTMEHELQDIERVYAHQRRRLGEINSISVKMMIDARLDDLDVPPHDHFAAFPARTPFEKELADKRIRSYEADLDLQARRKHFEDTHGVHLEQDPNKVLGIPPIGHARKLKTTAEARAEED